MAQTKEYEKVKQKVVATLARMLVIAPESVTMDARYAELFNSDPKAVRDFAAQVEQSLGVIVGDSAISACPTVAELVDYCAKARAAATGGRRYAVLCRMPDGNTCERIYVARGHEKAVQQAMADGVEAVLSVEREDVEDLASNKSSKLSWIIIPLFLGTLLAGAAFVFFWWRNGFQRVW